MPPHPPRMCRWGRLFPSPLHTVSSQDQARLVDIFSFFLRRAVTIARHLFTPRVNRIRPLSCIHITSSHRVFTGPCDMLICLQDQSRLLDLFSFFWRRAVTIARREGRIDEGVPWYTGGGPSATPATAAAAATAAVATAETTADAAAAAADAAGLPRATSVAGDVATADMASAVAAMVI